VFQIISGQYFIPASAIPYFSDFNAYLCHSGIDA
jgi:hypothetical protein